jgi:hypothetical protein
MRSDMRGIKLMPCDLCVRLQVLRQTQALKESLGLSDSQAAQLSRELVQLRTALAETQAAADTNQQQVGGRHLLSKRIC